MKLSLMIQVYNGGDYWRQCWDSVVANIDFFDDIFVSVSNSPQQKNDVARVRAYDSPKVHLLVHDSRMTAVEHGKKMWKWVASFEPAGHVFILCHDDILCREGLRELKALDLKKDDAVFGPWHFFSDDGTERDLIVRQFRRDDGKPLSKEFFGFLVDQQPYLINVSGIVIPSEIFKYREFPWNLCRYGSRSEYLFMCSLRIRQVYQPTLPAVKIRRHQNSEGVLASDENNMFDTLLYLNMAFKVYDKLPTRLFTIQSFLYIIRRKFFTGVLFLILTQYRLWSNGYLRKSDILKIWYSLISAGGKKTVSRIAGALGIRR